MLMLKLAVLIGKTNPSHSSGNKVKSVLFRRLLHVEILEMLTMQVQNEPGSKPWAQKSLSTQLSLLLDGG